jgi:hypothetical protein
MFFYEHIISEAVSIEKFRHLKLNVLKSLPPRLTGVFVAVTCVEGGLRQTLPIDKIEDKRLFLVVSRFCLPSPMIGFALYYDFVGSDSRMPRLVYLGRRIVIHLGSSSAFKIWQVSTASHGSTSAEELLVILQKPTCPQPMHRSLVIRRRITTGQAPSAHGVRAGLCQWRQRNGHLAMFSFRLEDGYIEDIRTLRQRPIDPPGRAPRCFPIPAPRSQSICLL